MPFPPPKKKPKGDLALLIPEEEPTDEMPEEEGDLDDLEDDGDLPEEEPLAAEGDDPFADEAAPSIDPEQAALCETLGFTEPEQQQALIDLVKLINSADSMGSTESESALPPLPESAY